MLPPPPELLQALRGRDRFVIATHRGPDGDALGGSLALGHALRAQGKSVLVAAPNIPGEHYLWMPGAEALVQELAEPGEVTLTLDCDSLGRLDHLEAVVSAAPLLAHIDHHSGQPFGHLQYVDRHAAASSCLVWRILQALQWPISPDMAACLYAGIATDTGFFRFENTNSEAFAIGADLVAHGAVPSRIAELVTDRRPLRRLRLGGRALASLQSVADDRIVWGVLAPEDYAATGCSAADTESIIDQFKQAEHQEVCVLFKTPRAGEKWQVSLRSRAVDVAAVARRYGGGGHARAAGFDYAGSLDELRDDLLRVLEGELAGGELDP